MNIWLILLIQMNLSPCESTAPLHHPPPAAPRSLMFIRVICTCLLYQRRPDCHFLWFVALQTRLCVTGEMSLLYIKQFVCLGKSIFIVLPFESFPHFLALVLLSFPPGDAQHSWGWGKKITSVQSLHFQSKNVFKHMFWVQNIKHSLAESLDERLDDVVIQLKKHTAILLSVVLTQHKRSLHLL